MSNSKKAEVILWHEKLGSIDEQATEEEIVQSILYLYDSSDVSVSSTSTTRQERLNTKALQMLQFVQGLVAFTRSLSEQKAHEQWIRVSLTKRTYYLREIEPHIFLALGVELEHTMKHPETVMEQFVQDLYQLFCLFHGTITRNIMYLNPEYKTNCQVSNGIDILLKAQVIRKARRKVQIAIDQLDTDSSDLSKLLAQVDTMTQQLEELELASPRGHLWDCLDHFVPTYLHVLDPNNSLTFLQDFQGISYYPCNQKTFIDLQSLLNTFQLTSDTTQVDQLALFYKGNLLWSSMKDQKTLRLMYLFFRLREQEAMVSSLNSNTKGLWMANGYSDTFLPIWSSKKSYAELQWIEKNRKKKKKKRTKTGSSSKRITTAFTTALRSPHKLSDSNTEVVEGPSTSSSIAQEDIEEEEEDQSVPELLSPRSFIRNRLGTVSYLNGGFLLKNGHFATSLELEQQQKRNGQHQLWSALLFDTTDTDTPPKRLIQYHDSDMTLFLVMKPSKSIQMSSNSLFHTIEELVCLEAIEKFFEKPAAMNSMESNGRSNSRLGDFAHLLQHTKYTQSNRSSSRNSFPPPFLYLNRMNLAFKAHQLRRFGGGGGNLNKQMDYSLSSADTLYPLPMTLIGEKLLPAWKEIIHHHIQSMQKTREICIKTHIHHQYNGWILWRTDQTTKRHLICFIEETSFSSSTSSSSSLSSSSSSSGSASFVHVQDVKKLLLQEYFGNVFF